MGVRAALAGLAGLASVTLLVAPSTAAPPTPVAPLPNPTDAAGRLLFVEGCSSCHGFDAAGVEGRGPTLRGVGEQAADFYLRTGRMPLANPGDQPLRSEPAYGPREIDRIVSYIGSFGGPDVPVVEPAAGSVSEGQRLFADSCSGCHAITGQGGVTVGAVAPKLTEATPTQIAEAIRVGPYVMPAFGRRQLSDQEVSSIARYVEEVVDRPEDAGGWGIGHIGPVPEGMVAWLLAAVALLVVARIIGERREDSP